MVEIDRNEYEIIVSVMRKIDDVSKGSLRTCLWLYGLVVIFL